MTLSLLSKAVAGTFVLEILISWIGEIFEGIGFLNGSLNLYGGIFIAISKIIILLFYGINFVV